MFLLKGKFNPPRLGQVGGKRIPLGLDEAWKIKPAIGSRYIGLR